MFIWFFFSGLSILMKICDGCTYFGMLPDEQFYRHLPVNVIAGIDKIHLAHSHLNPREWQHIKWAINCGVSLGLPAAYCWTSVDMITQGWVGITRGPFYQHGLTLIPAWISDHMPNGCTVEVWWWKNRSMSKIMLAIITHPYMNLGSSKLVKGALSKRYYVVINEYDYTNPSVTGHPAIGSMRFIQLN